MADLTIVAGECGRGSGEYDTGVFKLPGPSDRGAETIAEIVVHGGVGEKQSTLGQMLGTSPLARHVAPFANGGSDLDE